MTLRSRTAIALVSLAVLAIAGPATAQSDQHEHGAPDAQPRGDMGGMMGMMQGCREMMRGGHAMPHLPPGK